MTEQLVDSSTSPGEPGEPQVEGPPTQPARYRTWADDLRDRAENAATEEERAEARVKLDELMRPKPQTATAGSGAPSGDESTAKIQRIAVMKRFLAWRYGNQSPQVVYGNSWKGEQVAASDIDALLERV